ncbi:MAG: cell division protein ZapA [Lachnospiraceae bacterium]|nr:cell division protein ZapA [Lachnospiraceae bacterium]
MADMNETQVIIAGKVLTLTGYETAEYTQKVANYINKKMDECRNAVSFRSQNKETQMLLVALNIADDYMKISERLVENEQLIKDKDKEIYNLKHDIVTTQSRLDKADEQVRTLQDKMAESSKKLIQLDAKLRTRDKNSKTEKEDKEEKESKSEAKSESKAEAKSESKPEPKSEPKPAPAPEPPKQEAPKAEAPKQEEKVDATKPEVKTEEKAEEKKEEEKKEEPKVGSLRMDSQPRLVKDKDIAPFPLNKH